MPDNGDMKGLLQFMVVATTCGAFIFCVWADIFLGKAIPQAIHFLFTGVTGWLLGRGLKGKLIFK